jgi:hypothetical protein
MKLFKLFKRKIKFKDLEYKSNLKPKEKLDQEITIRRGPLFTVAYSNVGKKMFVDRKIFRKIYKIFKSGKSKFEDSQIKLTIIDVISEYWNQEETLANMVLELKDTNQKFYIKVGNSWPMEVNGKIERLNFGRPVEEMGMLKLISDHGVNVVPAHFGVTIRGFNFIVYDCVPFITVSDARPKGFISGRTEKKISNLLNEISKEVNFKLQKDPKKYGFKELKMISDLKPENTFFDLNSKKLFVFDPNSVAMNKMAESLFQK